MAQMLPINPLGMIKIPEDIRSQLNWKEGTMLELALVDPIGRGIVIREYGRRCSVCGGKDRDVRSIGYANICTNCRDIIIQE